MADIWIASLVALWILVLFLAYLLAGALRQIGLFQLRLGDDPGALITDTGLPRGTVAPDFEAADRETGQPKRLSELPAHPQLLLFLSPSCLACRKLLPHLKEIVKTRKREFDFVVICTGADLHACRQFANDYSVDGQVLVDESGRIAKAYEATLTPFAYLLDYQRRILMRGVANDWRGLESMLNQEGTPQAGTVWIKTPTTDATPVGLREVNHG